MLKCQEIFPISLDILINYSQKILMDFFIKQLKALSDINRMRIFLMVCHRPLCVCELDAAMDSTLPTISNNLKILKNAGLVHSKKDGRWIIYEMVDDILVKKVLKLILSEFGDHEVIKNDINFIGNITRETCSIKK